MADYDSSLPIFSRDATKPVAVSKDTSANANSNPIFVRVGDGTDELQVVVDGAAVGTTGVHVLGTDGTNAQILQTDTSGKLSVRIYNDGTNQMPTGHNGANGIFTKVSDGTTDLSVAVDGAATKTNGVQVLGTDGTNAQILETDTGGRLKVRVYNDGTNQMPTGHNEMNPIYVSVVPTIGTNTEVFDFFGPGDASYTAPTANGGTPANHEYTVSADKKALLKQIMASSSGAMKIVLQTNQTTTGVYGTPTTHGTWFTSMANPNFDITLATPLELSDPAGTETAKYILKLYCREAVSVDVYSTLVLNEI